MSKTFETDWLSSNPIFYNEESSCVSENINDVIDFENFEFHPEGLKNYLDFGYSVFGQTPIKNIKFLKPCTRLTIQDDGSLKFTSLEDPVDSWTGKQTHEEDVFHLLNKYVGEWEQSVEGEIILPTSGGVRTYCVAQIKLSSILYYYLIYANTYRSSCGGRR